MLKLKLPNSILTFLILLVLLLSNMKATDLLVSKQGEMPLQQDSASIF